ncbi:hypothetical protein M2390_001704 [Mycetocola sp. BIGb0189]|uniref:SIR2 family protein n=1 Tax=Mycetocola sp. BIGb0189 TaxID=2940604 RepID=UPI0021684523|nr:SIR2 family protein [Mycetocola sp. BIGb0189]MCS4276522.1 hypothetical protein [Mycetocola sp. BIGb0189]
MSAPDLTPAIMAQFAASGADKHLTLLLGAGASVASGLPDWNELAVRLLLRSGAVRERRLAELLVREQDPLLVAEAAKQSLGTEWEASVRQALYGDLQGPGPSTLHFAIARHYVDEDPGKTTLITLNFDTLLEQAVLLLSTRPRSRAEKSASQFVSGPEPGVELLPRLQARVHHLHGVVGPTSTKNLVLALSDYNEILSAGMPWQQVLLIQSLRRGALILVGTSYRDPDVRKWFHHVMRDHPRNHSAIVLLVRESFRLGRDDFDEILPALASQWKAIGLEPVITSDFSDAVQIVQELAHIHRPGYLSPQERTRLIWDGHTARFNEYQDSYARRLESEAHDLCHMLHGTNVRTGLWIADGNGYLVRWAVSDRIYRSPDVLTSVPTGQESSVLAGRALSAEAPLWEEPTAHSAHQWGCSLAIPVWTQIRELPPAVTAVHVIDFLAPIGQMRAALEINALGINGLETGWGDRLSHVVSTRPA